MSRPNSDVVDLTKWTHERLDWHLAVCCDSALRDRAKLLASLLLHDFDLRKGGCAWRGQEGENSLTERAGWKDPRTVQLAAQELEAAGYLRIERGRGRGKSNQYWPVFDRQKADVEPPFRDPEKADAEPPFKAEKADPGAVKGGSTSALLRKDSCSSLSVEASERETVFDRLVEACPAGMLKFADLGAARMAFDDLVEAGRDPQALIGALQAMAAAPEYRSRKHPPQLQDWLGKGMWRGWLERAVAEPAPSAAEAQAARTAFAGPPEVAAELGAIADVTTCLAGAGWRDADRTILTLSGWARDELVRRIKPPRLAELNIRVERAAPAQGNSTR